MFSHDSATIPYTISDILENFSDQSYVRGQSYAKQGRVAKIRFVGANHLAADVRGTRRIPYKVEIEITNFKNKIVLDGICTCPMGGDCKHVVATLLEGIKQFPQYSNPLDYGYSNYESSKIIDVTPVSSPVSSTRGAAESSYQATTDHSTTGTSASYQQSLPTYDSTVDTSVDKASPDKPIANTVNANTVNRLEQQEFNLDKTAISWLDDLNASTELPPDQFTLEASKTASAARKVLIYILSPSRGPEAFVISPVTVSILKSGMFGSQKKNYRIDNVEPYNRAKYVQDNDVVILRLIFAFVSYTDRYNASFKIPIGAEGLILLKLLIESGRCYLENELHPENHLTMGQLRNGTIEWKIDSDGGQTINVNVEKVRIENATSIGNVPSNNLENTDYENKALMPMLTPTHLSQTMEEDLNPGVIPIHEPPQEPTRELAQEIIQQSTTQGPLTLGPITQAQGQIFESSSKPSKKSSNEVAPLVLKFQPLYYLCPVTRTVGILEIGGLPHKQVVSLLNAPRIKAEQSQLFHQKLGTIFGNEEDKDNKLLPAILTIRDFPVKPVPILKFTTIPINVQKVRNWSKYIGEEISLPAVSLSFNYAEKTISYNDKRKELNLFKNGEVLVIPRDKQAEEENIQQLGQLGLNLTLGGINDYYHIKPEYNFYITIGQLKNGQLKENFHKDKKLSTLWNHFMQSALPVLREQGWEIKIEQSFPYNIIYAQDEWYAEVEEGSGIDWFSVELGVYVDGQRFNLVPILLDLLKKEKDIFTIIDKLPSKSPLLVSMEDGRRLALPSERAKILLGTLQHLFSFQDNVDEAGKLKMRELEAGLLAEIEASAKALNMRWYGGDKIRSLGKKLKDFQSIKATNLLASFNGQLRSYQQEGLNWLQFLREYNLAGILADDMGLGKTVQILAHIATEKAEQRLDIPVLVIAATSLMVNWKMETLRFVPSLKVLVLHGSNRRTRFQEIKEYDLILTTYPLLLRDKDELLAFEYHTLILDEAQNIKNANAKITQIVNQIKAKHRICMTGTPLENHLGELWSLFNFLVPGYLGSQKQFGNLFRIPIEKNGDVKRSTTLMRRIKPFILRRTKQQVVTELPPKTEIVRMVELEGAQRDLYETIRSAMYTRVKEALSNKGMDKSHIIVLDALLKLRQVCCDPSLLKMEAAKSINESAKLRELINMITSMIEEGRKILLFSQFTSMLALIENELKKLSIPYVKLIGSTTDRETPIRSFQEGKVSLFLISLKAGGIGLNLTAADTVIHYDPWWNPAVENQATDRAYRIGQDKPVFVYKLITAGTVEEKIIEMQVKKRKLMDSLFDPMAKASTKLSASDIQTLFEPLS